MLLSGTNQLVLQLNDTMRVVLPLFVLYSDTMQVVLKLLVCFLIQCEKNLHCFLYSVKYIQGRMKSQIRIKFAKLHIQTFKLFSSKSPTAFNHNLYKGKSALEVVTRQDRVMESLFLCSVRPNNMFALLVPL